jgi:hypothetical protein
MASEELRVFLASPSDVARERKLAREIIERLNHQVGPQLGILLRPVGWENVRLGFGRPQSLINPEVASADVFVGILGKRWGTPTGVASSGFAEEFAAIRARAEAGENVEVLLFVLRLTEEDLVDPGDQLKQMLQFRSEVMSLAMIREYATPEDFGRELALELAAVATSRSPLPAGSPAGGAVEPPAPVAPTETPGVSPGTSGSASVEQVLLALEAARRATSSEGVEPPLMPDGEHYDAFSIARLNLLARAWTSKTGTNDPLSVHEINRIYDFRERVQVSPVETELVLRTMCSFPQLAPGWAILKASDVEAAAMLLFEASLNQDRGIREGALGLLTPVGIEQWIAANLDRSAETVGRFLLEHNAADSEPPAVLVSLLEGIDEAEPLLVSLATADTQPSPRARNALVRRRSRTDLNSALELSEDVSLDSATTRALRFALQAAPHDVVRAALSHSVVEIRRLAFDVLSEAGELSAEEARTAMSDSDRELRVAALEQRAKLGDQLPTDVVDQVLQVEPPRPRWMVVRDLRERADLAAAKAKPVDTLLGEINYMWLQTAPQYRALAEDHFERFGAQVRRDLGDGFASFKAESRGTLVEGLMRGVEDQLREKAPPTPDREAEVRQALDTLRAKAEQRVDELAGEEKYNKTTFAGAALAGIAANGDASDAPVVRAWLSEIDAVNRLEAIRALARAGGAEDVAALIAQADTSYGEERETAVKAALAFAPGPDGIARTLVSERADELAVMAARNLEAYHTDTVDEGLLLILLNSESDEVRRAGIAIALAQLDDDGLRRLLARYLNQSYRYYNVIVALDRAIFGPSWIAADI